MYILLGLGILLIWLLFHNLCHSGQVTHSQFIRKWNFKCENGVCGFRSCLELEERQVKEEAGTDLLQTVSVHPPQQPGQTGHFLLNPNIFLFFQTLHSAF